MGGLTKKHIVVAVILAVLGVVTVLLLLKYMKGNPVNLCVFQEDGVEYSGDFYQLDDTTLKLEDGTELELELITYFPVQKELQFGFSLPESEELKDKEPFKMELVDASTNSPVTKNPFYISEPRDGQYHYRAVFRSAEIDAEKSEDLILSIKDSTGKTLYSEVFITSKTLFTAKPFSSLDSQSVFKATLGSETDPNSSQSNSSKAA